MTAAISHAERLGYRPELDGLRAIAVFMVISAHYVGWAGAGRAGVIIFFVLSGFLITTLLKEEFATRGRVDVRAFYARRARRLLPALMVMLTVVGLIALASGAVGQVAGVALSIAYLGNWASQLGVDMGVLGHMWSLGVEEQFYLALPVALLSTRRFAQMAWAAIPGIVALIVVNDQPGFLAILVGCGLAQLRWRRALRVSDSQVVAAVAFLLALSLVDEFSRLWSSPGFLISGAGGAVVIIWALQSPRRLLSLRPITYLGRISYGVYLWHLPVGLLLHEPLVGSGVPSPVALLLLVCLTVVIASYSYRLVERPVTTGAGFRALLGGRSMQAERQLALHSSLRESG